MEFLPSASEFHQKRQSIYACAFEISVLTKAEEQLKQLNQQKWVNLAYDDLRCEILKEFTTSACLNKGGVIMEKKNFISITLKESWEAANAIPKCLRVDYITSAVKKLNDEFVLLNKGFEARTDYRTLPTVFIYATKIEDLPGVFIANHEIDKKI
jgi:hypothetical protein